MALELINEGIKMNEDYAGYYCKGTLLLQTGNYDDALNSFITSNSLFQNYYDSDDIHITFIYSPSPILIPQKTIHHQMSRTLTKKGQTLCNSKQYSDAISNFDNALQYDPSNYKAYVAKGRAFVKINQVEDAIACFDKAIGVLPAKETAYLEKGDLEKGELLLTSGNLEAAASCFREAVQLGTKQSDLYFTLAKINETLRNFEEALSCYDKLISIKTEEPEKAELYYFRGNVLIELGMFSEAIDSFNKVFELNPNNEALLSKAGFQRVSAQVQKLDLEK